MAHLFTQSLDIEKGLYVLPSARPRDSQVNTAVHGARGINGSRGGDVIDVEADGALHGAGGMHGSRTGGGRGGGVGGDWGNQLAGLKGEDL